MRAYVLVVVALLGPSRGTAWCGRCSACVRFARGWSTVGRRGALTADQPRHLYEHCQRSTVLHVSLLLYCCSVLFCGLSVLPRAFFWFVFLLSFILLLLLSCFLSFLLSLLSFSSFFFCFFLLPFIRVFLLFLAHLCCSTRGGAVTKHTGHQVNL